MPRHALLAAAAGLLLIAGGRSQDAATKDRNRLQGYWDVVSAERDGTPMAKKDLKDWQVIFTGDRLTLNKGAKGRFDAKYRVNPAKKPKRINVTFLMGREEGKTFKGIYTLKGDRLKLCWNESGEKRPTRMSTKPKSGRTLYVLKRGKAR
jgi:uncharacterized protein (TIGR03067 family)